MVRGGDGDAIGAHDIDIRGQQPVIIAGQQAVGLGRQPGIIGLADHKPQILQLGQQLRGDLISRQIRLERIDAQAQRGLAAGAGVHQALAQRQGMNLPQEQRRERDQGDNRPEPQTPNP